VAAAVEEEATYLFLEVHQKQVSKILAVVAVVMQEELHLLKVDQAL
jgi:hypothetical protein